MAIFKLGGDGRQSGLHQSLGGRCRTWAGVHMKREPGRKARGQIVRKAKEDKAASYKGRMTISSSGDGARQYVAEDPWGRRS